MRIVAICPFLPYPGAGHAGADYLLHHLERLSKSHEITAFGVDSPESAEVADRVPPALNLAALLPLPDAHVRDRLYHRALGQFRWHTLFAPPWELAAMIAPARSALSGADVIELHWGGWLLPIVPHLRRAAPGAAIVVVPYDVPWQAYARWRALDLNGGLRRWGFGLSLAAIRRWQVHLLQRSDAVLVHKIDDGRLLARSGVRRPTLVVDPPLDVPGQDSARRRRSRRAGRTVLFTGAFGRPENHRSALWFVDHVWSTVQHHCPDARLILAGGDPPAMLRARATETIVITGYVDSLDSFYEKADIFVAPLVAGAGLRFKVPQAMLYGLPVVATHLAAEGVLEEAGRETFGAVTDDPADMARSLVDLLSRPEVARDIGERGRQWAMARYDFDASIERVVDLYRRLHPHGS